MSLVKETLEILGYGGTKINRIGDLLYCTEIRESKKIESSGGFMISQTMTEVKSIRSSIL
jgi:hypothetical protein